MIILFGLAGSGKGTQGKALSEAFDLSWISTGDLVRNSQKFAAIIDRGDIIKDEDMFGLLEGELNDLKKAGRDVILEGFPRTANQAIWLLAREKVDGAVILDVPKDELYQRLVLRAKAEGRGDDQEKASIDRRFAVFEQNICSILPLFETAGIPVEHVDGVGTVSEVTDRLIKVVKKFVQEKENSHV